METYYAPPEKASDDDLDIDIQFVQNNPVFSGLLHSVSGLLAVLNKQRQILALNDSFLKALGIENPEEALGLRHGEAFRCVHADDGPGGCGTTKYCSTCGAAIAIVSSMNDGIPVERLCALKARRGGKPVDIALLVKAQPVNVEGKELLLILVQDVTVEQRRAALERTFFHDISNLAGGLLYFCESMAQKDPKDLTYMIRDTALRLNGEIAIQKYLSQIESGAYRPSWRSYSANKMTQEAYQFFGKHPAATDKRVDCTMLDKDVTLTTDTSALFRVLCNMVLNALEATDDGGVVKLWLEQPQEGLVVFNVWNQAVIPETIQSRLFQRNFSTKAESGRGIGTFSMKLLGEDILGGQVEFTSTPESGTVFRFTHSAGVLLSV